MRDQPGQPRYRRVLLKLSGEALMGDAPFGWHRPTLERFAAEIARVRDAGVEVAVVVGGGNVFRGARSVGGGLDRAPADHMGMLATVMNAIAFVGALEAAGLAARVVSAVPIAGIAPGFDRRRAMRDLAKGRVVVFGGGTGNPFFTTDTAAALRAVEIGADALCKGTQVDGVYSADPKTDKAAERYASLGYQEVLARDLQVMDAAAIALARDNRLPVLVFSIHRPGSFLDVVCGAGTFTIVE
jgi:uridylate kinase